MKQVTSSGAAIFRKHPVTSDFQLLLVSSHGKKYNLPKGHVEDGESLLLAAERKVFEECEIKFTLLPIEPLAYEFITKERRVNKTVHIYIAEFASGTVYSDGTTNHDWENVFSGFVNVKDVLDDKYPLTFSVKPTILEAIQKYISFVG